MPLCGQHPRLTPAPPSLPAASNHKIPEEDIEAYGEDLIKASQRWAEMHYTPIINQLEQRLRSVEGNTQRIEHHTAAQSVEQALDRAVPDWGTINVDPAFITWLGQTDPFSGHTRKAMITDAHARGDAPRTIAFFQAFKNEQTLVDPPRGTQSGQTGGSSPADRLPLENLAAPGVVRYPRHQRRALLNGASGQARISRSSTVTRGEVSGVGEKPTLTASRPISSPLDGRAA